MSRLNLYLLNQYLLNQYLLNQYLLNLYLLKLDLRNLHLLKRRRRKLHRQVFLHKRHPLPNAVALSKEAQAEANVAQAMRTFKLEGWTARPLEIYPKHVTAQNESNAADMTPGNQLYGLEPQMYEILAEFGMRKCYKRTYQRGQRFVQAAVYFFSSSEGAYGAYNFMRQGAATIVVRGAGSSEDDLSISFWKGKSFIRLSQTSEEDEESKEALRAIAKVIDAGIAPTSLPPLVLNQLPVLDRVNGTEKLVMGPNSGRKFFPAPYVGSLSLERSARR